MGGFPHLTSCTIDKLQLRSTPCAQLIVRLNKRGPLERGLFHNLRKKYAAICARLAVEVRSYSCCLAVVFVRYRQLF